MIDDVLAVLPDARTTPNGWEARCPAHDDSVRSLAVSLSEQGNVLVKCFAGCAFNDIVTATKLPKSAFFANGSTNNRRGGDSNKTGKSKRIVATYDYLDEQGNLLFQAVRMEPKAFRQRRPDPDTPGEWLWNLKGVRRVLYRLPELLTADPNRTVVTVEGERDVERLIDLGLVATCNPMGAGKWRDEYNVPLAGRPVIIIPDNDGPGLDHAIQVAESLLAVASGVKIVPLPDLPPGGDVSDWLDAGGTVDQLRALSEQTRPYAPPVDSESTISSLADTFIASLEPAWRRKCSSLYSVKLTLEIPLPQLWTHLNPTEINAVSDTVEGREMARNNKPPIYRQRVMALRDAVRLAAGKALPTLPEHLDSPINHELSTEDLESKLTAWLFKDRTFRLGTGNPKSITYYNWSCGVDVDSGWLQCYNSPVFARRSPRAAQPEIAVQGDLLVEELRYESKRALVRDLKQANLAKINAFIRFEGRSRRVWMIEPTLLERVASEAEKT